MINTLIITVVETAVKPLITKFAELNDIPKQTRIILYVAIGMILVLSTALYFTFKQVTKKAELITQLRNDYSDCLDTNEDLTESFNVIDQQYRTTLKLQREQIEKITTANLGLNTKISDLETIRNRARNISNRHSCPEVTVLVDETPVTEEVLTEANRVTDYYDFCILPSSLATVIFEDSSLIGDF